MSRLARNYDPLPAQIVIGHGSYLWDITGRCLIDMMSGYSAVSLGHSHPRIIDRLNAQAKTLCNLPRCYQNDLLEHLANRLVAKTGIDGEMIPMNSGAEAVETAIKAARRWGNLVKGIHDPYIIVADNNFHGRTTTIVGFSSDEGSKRGFGPFGYGFLSVPFNDIDALAAVIGSPGITAILIEPIQGEAGVIVPDKGYLKQIRELCDEYDVLMILDEVQSGFCRTGKWFAYEHEDIRPDGVCLGKALGGGVLPVSAFVGTKTLMDVFTPGSHGSTFGGNPLGCAVALETIDIMEEEVLELRSADLGQKALEFLKNTLEDKPLVKDVRGKGLWIGIELKEAARPICEELLTKGVLTKDTHHYTIRIAPPLNISEDLFFDALHRIVSVLKDDVYRSQIRRRKCGIKS